MDFLNIFSLGTTYRYDAKIEQNFEQKKQDFGSANQNQVRGAPKPRTKEKSKAW